MSLLREKFETIEKIGEICYNRYGHGTLSTSPCPKCGLRNEEIKWKHLKQK